jgi:hypothetical protein
MPADYIILAVIAILGVSGGIFLLFQAKNYRARHPREDKRLPHQPAH